jgi:hypothetical protein
MIYYECYHISKCYNFNTKLNYILNNMEHQTLVTFVLVQVNMTTPISHLAKHSTINMALKWHHKNIFNKNIIFIEFWRLPNVLFDSFDCDYTQYYYFEII